MTIETSLSRGRSPGRPRLQETDHSILNAAFDELCRAGYRGLTVDSVARRAGVGKPTVYRRFSGKKELASAALAARLTVPMPVDTASLRDDLTETLASDDAWLRSPEGAQLVGMLLVERETDPWLVDTLRRGVIRPRQTRYAAAIQRAIRRSEVNPNAIPSLVAMALWGTLLAAVLAGAIPNRRGLEALAETLIDGIGN